MTPRNIVEQIFNEKAKNDSNSKDLANMLNILTKTVFGDVNRFVFELLQNADDSPHYSNPNSGVDVVFRLSGNYLIFSHNGKHFDADDVKGISGIGNRQSNKDKDIEKTGYKGIGFKSVFGGSDQVYILSGEYSFRFDKHYSRWTNSNDYPWQVIPIWNSEPLPPFGVELNSSHVHTIIGIKDPTTIKIEVEKVFQDCQIMLFLRNIKSVTFFQYNKRVFKIEKKLSASGFIDLIKGGVLLSQWMIKEYIIQISDELTTKLNKLSDEECPQKLKQAKSTKLTFAARIHANEILEERAAVIYCYLPTKVSKGFSFLINGDFITNAERSDLLPNIWNEFLFSRIAVNSFEWAKELQETGLRFQVLKLLRAKFSSVITDIETAFNNALDNTAKSIAILPSEKTGKLTLIADSIIDNTGFARYFDSTLISTYLKTQAVVLDYRLEKTAVLTKLGARSFSIEDLCKMVSAGGDAQNKEAFLNKYLKIIEFFYQRIEEDKLDEWNTKLKETTFIPNENFKLKTPKEIFFPIQEAHNDETGFITLNTVHSTLFTHLQKDSRIISWLHSLGIKEPSLLEIVKKSIIPIIQSDGITNMNFLALTRFVFRVYSSGALSDKDYQELTKLKLATNNGLNLPTQCYLPDIYNPEQKLEGIMPTANFVSPFYPESINAALNWKPFLKKIGVNDNLTITVDPSSRERVDFCRKYPFAEAYFTWLDDNEYYPSLYRPWKLSGQHGIINFTFIEFKQHLNVYAFSKTFWKSVVNNWELFINQCSATLYYHRGGSNSVPSYVKYYIQSENSIPCKDGKCYNATTVYHPSMKVLVNDFFPVADIDGAITKEQNVFFEFKTTVSFENCLEILDKLPTLKIKSEHIKQINAVYEELIAMADDLTVQQVEMWRDWKKKARVLCLDSSFQPLSSLFYFNAPGVSSPSNSEFFIRLSDELSYTQIEKLCFLLDLSIVGSDKLIFEADNSVQDANLKSALLHVVKYLALVINRQYREQAESTLLRLSSRLTETVFYKSDSLSLVYRNTNGKDIYNAKIDSWHDKKTSAFYFVGKWNSPLTLYSLGSSLCAFLEISRLERELTLMLQLSETEIIQWLRDSGHSVEEFLEITSQIMIGRAIEDTEEDTEAIPDDIVIQYETFVQKVAPAEIDYTNVQPEVKMTDFGSIPVLNHNQYSELKGQQAKVDVGRWSEEFVHNYLLSNQQLFSSIQWVNETGESGLPYDFIVKENGVEKVVEVKGTPSDNKAIIPISPAEWKLLFETGSSYVIFRVYGVGTENFRFERIDNPAEAIQKGLYLPNPLNLQI